MKWEKPSLIQINLRRFTSLPHVSLSLSLKSHFFVVPLTLKRLITVSSITRNVACFRKMLNKPHTFNCDPVTHLHPITTRAIVCIICLNDDRECYLHDLTDQHPSSHGVRPQQ